MFCILVIINPGVDGKESQSILGYDCSSPRDLKIWDASTRCKDELERKLEAYYCGLLSYAKPILSAEQEETLLRSAQENFKRTGDQVFAVSSQEKFGQLKGKLENLISWQKTGIYIL